MNANILEPLGFDKKTEKVYRSLLSLADAPVSQVAKQAGLKRTSVYHVLENLSTYGLVSTYKSRGTKRYFAENPNKLKAYFEQKMFIAERLLPLLQADINKGRAKVKFRLFEGIEGMKSITEESLDIKEKIIYTIGSSQMLLGFVGGKYAYGARRRKKGIRMRSLRFLSDKSDSSPKRIHQFKVLPQDFEFPGYILIFDNKVGCCIFEAGGFGFIVESKEYALMMKSVFNVLWMISK